MTAAPDGFPPNPAQEIRDELGLGHTCSACGHPGTERDPLVMAADGYRVHISHLITEGDGYYGVPFASEVAA